MSIVEQKLAELKEKQAVNDLGGGEKRIAAQHEKGKLTADERIKKLFDKGTFVEIDSFVSHRCHDLGLENTTMPRDGIISGYGQIDGRIVYAYAQDFTVSAGSLGEMHAQKICKVMDLAMKAGAPCIGINDSGGARIQEGVDALNGYGEIFKRNSLSSGVIPQISVIMGPCAGGAVYSPALTDFIFMVDKTSQMFITGPQVIKAVTGEDVSAEELGGAMTHNKKSGNAHFFAKDEDECIAQIKTLLSYIPSNNGEAPSAHHCTDPIDRAEDSLRNLIPEQMNRAYDMMGAIKAVADNGEFFPVQPYFAKNIITGFMRLGGGSVGVIANQPKFFAGSLDINCSDKAARFIRFCDAFNIPIITFVDTPGYLPGVKQEEGGIIRHGAKLLYSYSEANVPKITVIIKKAYGGAYLAMCSKALGADTVIAWPTAEIAVMGAQGAANIVFRKDIEAAEDKDAKRQEKIAEYEKAFNNPYCAASRGFVDMVIDPAETRYYLIRSLEAMENKIEDRPEKKHGNMPL